MLLYRKILYFERDWEKIYFYFLVIDVELVINSTAIEYEGDEQIDFGCAEFRNRNLPHESRAPRQISHGDFSSAGPKTLNVYTPLIYLII